ncbi:MAG: 4Fe-4S dicluster domain-containing protein [Spirochaetia bacterium]
MLFFFFRRAGGIQAVQLGYFTEHGFSTTDLHSLIVYTLVVLLFFILSLILGKRGACHTIYWIAPFMVLGKKLGSIGKIPSLTLKTDPNACVSCRRCDSACPMSLNVSVLVKDGRLTHSDCILCGNCVDTCAKGAIKFSW